MLLVEHKFNTSCQSFTMWFLGFEKKEKKRFALGLGINKQLLNMLCGIFRKSTSWLSF
jgi:hypothetical protein